MLNVCIIWSAVNLLQCRVGFGMIGVTCQYYALQYITVGETAAIILSNPIVVTFTAFFFLGEPLGFVPVFMTFISVGGVIMIALQPKAENAHTPCIVHNVAVDGSTTHEESEGDRTVSYYWFYLDCGFRITVECFFNICMTGVKY